MAEPFMPAHEPAADADPAKRDTTIDDDDVIIDPEAPAFHTPAAGDRLTENELAANLDRDEPGN